jgi:hypothetical protein
LCTVCSNSYTPPHFGRGRLLAGDVVRRRASKALLGSSGAAPASTQPGRRPPAPEPLALAHPGDAAPESTEDAGPLAERSRCPGFGSGLVPERALAPAAASPRRARHTARATHRAGPCPRPSRWRRALYGMIWTYGAPRTPHQRKGFAGGSGLVSGGVMTRHVTPAPGGLPGHMQRLSDQDSGNAVLSPDSCTDRR